MNKKQKLGSETAKGGFKNEHEIAVKFSDYKKDQEAQLWLNIMGYNHKKIQKIKVHTIPPRISSKKAIEYGATELKIEETLKYKKADIQIKIEIVLDNILYTENLSLKKANKDSNFNQIDKRSVDAYQKMWGFNNSIAQSLKKFTGEIIPTKEESKKLKDKRRWYLSELSPIKAEEIIKFFINNKTLVFNDLIKGRGVLLPSGF